jgi:hypothetical protein
MVTEIHFYRGDFSIISDIVRVDTISSSIPEPVEYLLDKSCYTVRGSDWEAKWDDFFLGWKAVEDIDQ